MEMTGPTGPVLKHVATAGRDLSTRSGKCATATRAGGRKTTTAAATSRKGRHQAIRILRMTLWAGNLLLVRAGPHDNLEFVSAFLAFKFIDWHSVSPPFVPVKFNVSFLSSQVFFPFVLARYPCLSHKSLEFIE